MSALVATLLVVGVSVTGLQKGYVPLLDYMCHSNTGYVGVLWDCTGYIQCVYGKAVWMNCAPGSEFNLKTNECSWIKGRCEDLDDSVLIECPKDPQMRFPHPKKCAMFYDCSEKLPKYPLSKYNRECPFPKLFDENSLTCLHHDLVKCGKREMPMDQCSYELECMDKECVGKPDGKIPDIGPLFGGNYIVCANEKVVSRQECDVTFGEVFDGVSNMCTTKKEETVDNICKNRTRLFQDPAACHRYFNCSSDEVTKPLLKFQKECAYPQLFEIDLEKCMPFSEVTCGSREEETTPCTYPIGRCAGTTCIPCDAVCSYKPDGPNAYIGHKSNYLTCKKGRTVAINNCASGFEYNPGVGECTSNIARNKSTLMSTGAEEEFALSVDGNDDAHITQCSKTNDDDTNQWWQVDLLATYAIRSVTITNTEGQAGWYLHDLAVEISETDPHKSSVVPILCAHHSGIINPAATVTVKCLQETKGRFVRISRIKGTSIANQSLILCEVRVDGWSNCSCQSEIQTLNEKIDRFILSTAIHNSGFGPIIEVGIVDENQGVSDESGKNEEFKNKTEKAIGLLVSTLDLLKTDLIALKDTMDVNTATLTKATGDIDALSNSLRMISSDINGLKNHTAINTEQILNTTVLDKLDDQDRFTQLETQLKHLQCKSSVSTNLTSLETSVHDGHLTTTFVCKDEDEIYCGNNTARCNNGSWEFDADGKCLPRRTHLAEEMTAYSKPFPCGFGIGSKVEFLVKYSLESEFNVQVNSNSVPNKVLVEFIVYTESGVHYMENLFIYVFLLFIARFNVQVNSNSVPNKVLVEFIVYTESGVHYFPTENNGTDGWVDLEHLFKGKTVLQITIQVLSTTTQVSFNGTQIFEVINPFNPNDNCKLDIDVIESITILSMDIDVGKTRNAATPPV